MKDLLNRLSRASKARFQSPAALLRPPTLSSNAPHENRFDRLARDLAGGLSRREALRRFALTMAAGLLAEVTDLLHGSTLVPVAAQPIPGAAACSSNTAEACVASVQADFAQVFADCVFQPVAGAGNGVAPLWMQITQRAACLNQSAATAGAMIDTCLSATAGCPTGTFCSNDVCCPEGLSGCSGQCCASCCKETCCTDDQECCNDACVDVKHDASNCGGCGVLCPAGEVCVNGRCTCGGRGSDCPAGQTCCNGVCQDVQHDPHNCGACGHACSSPAHGEAVCQQGQCGVVCDQPFATCAGSSAGVCGTDLSSDVHNCGSCGHSCTSGQTCCSGGCVSLQTSASNCSACGHACGSGQSCCAGVCVSLINDINNCGACGHTCSSGQTCCSGVCVSLQTSASNCGACGHACASGQICCSGACVSSASDGNNCGGCGVVCGEGKHCVSGVCVAGQPAVSLNRDHISFADLPVGQTAGPLCFTISNTGAGPLNITDVSIVRCSDSVDPSYVDCSSVAGLAITSGGGAATVAAGQSREVCISFSPKKAATFDATVLINSNAASSPSLVTLHGTGDKQASV